MTTVFYARPMVDLHIDKEQSQKKRNFIEQIKAPFCLDLVLAIETM